MRSYELTVIIDPDIAEEDIPQAMEKFTTLITKSGGSITEVDHWGRRKLAYPIDHHGEGNYVMMQLEFEPVRTAELKVGLNLAAECLRHLLVRVGN
ncbi:MAG: 30S ribosomal protein S6 [Chloroflexi bacterium CG07_land_8_20_14_0_80_51_10]|nr:MAG: 30S ribosomal protein S6 [Chloroflexi bacterium CG07_land_8_20_14_0_80_51_10]